MSDARISVIIPTIGRETLGAAIESCEGAEDLIVVFDEAAREPKFPSVEAQFKVVSVRGGDLGYTARNAGMKVATGTHLAFLDDDDVFLPGAIDTMRAHACDRPVIFKMAHPQLGIFWREPVLRYANVGTPMILVPNEPARLGVWAPYEYGRGGDFAFLLGCVEMMGDPVWRDELVCQVRPHTLGPSVAIVTPWLNHPELAPDYLRAVSEINAGDDVIVVDNASEPPVAFAKMTVRENVGFSKACNLGLNHAETDAVLFLNNDIAATRAGWLNQLRGELAPGRLIGAKIRTDAHGSVDGHPLPYLDGWCLAGMRDDLLELGGFDEDFDEPSYYGDNDLCLRARAAGMTLREIRVGLRHKERQTASDDRARVAVASSANRERFHRLARELLAL